MFKSITIASTMLGAVISVAVILPLVPSTASAGAVRVAPSVDKRGQRPKGYKKKRTKRVEVVFEKEADRKYLSYFLELAKVKTSRGKVQHWHHVATNQTNSYIVGWSTITERAVYKCRGKGKRRKCKFVRWEFVESGNGKADPRETLDIWSGAKTAKPGRYRITVRAVRPQLKR